MRDLCREKGSDGDDKSVLVSLRRAEAEISKRRYQSGDDTCHVSRL